MYITEVSDLDYSYNSATGKFDIPSVEWSDCYGTHWQRFESEEARTIALDKNEAYNNLPEVKACIEAQENAWELASAEIYTNEIFDHALENNKTLAVKDVLSFAESLSKITSDRIVQLVCQHNKLMMRARVQPKVATFTLGDLLKVA